MIPDKLGLPVRLGTGCNRTSDRKHSRSGRSPRRGSSQGTSAGTGCTGRSRSCSLSWTAQPWSLTAVGVCSLNLRGREGLKPHLVLQTHQMFGLCLHSLVGRQTEPQSFATQPHSTLTLLQCPLLQSLVWELNKATAPNPQDFQSITDGGPWLTAAFWYKVANHTSSTRWHIEENFDLLTPAHL